MSSIDHDSITTTLRYADPDKPAGILYARALDKSTNSFVYHDVVVRNARRSAEPQDLETTGFQLVKHRTKVTDFTSEEQIQKIYIPEIEALLKSLTGARRVMLFNPQARWEDGEARGLRKTAGNAHMDYNTDSFRQWVIDTLGKEEGEKEMASGRWAVYNVWRGVTPVERRPLAVCDGRTVDYDNDFKDVAIHMTPEEPSAPPLSGRNMLYNTKQKWYYFPLMQPDEALVFRQYDTGRTQIQPVAHSAIDDPTSLPDAKPRHSFEIRAALFF